jgi:single-stranded DNA-specific DHH superfamily exonuclease
LEDLYHPHLLKDMDRAVERIRQAKENDEKVMIF